MSEERAKYEVTGSQGGLPPNTLLRYSHPDYQPPTYKEVRKLKDISGLTGKELCEIAGVADQRSWRRWSQDPDEPGARSISYSVWRLLLLELGIVAY